MKTPKPGIYYDVAEAEYRAWDAVNISSLLVLADEDDGTPADYLYALTHHKESQPMKLGTAAHVATLQPELFKTQYILGPDCRRGTKEWKAFELEAGGRKILKPDEWYNALDMAKAVRANTGAVEYLTGGDAEVCFVWVNPETGILCKGKVDWLAGYVVPDLKTAAHMGDKFIKSRLNDHLYHVRSAWYLDGLKEADKTTSDEYGPFVHIWVRNTPPHLVRCTMPPARDIRAGRFEYLKLLERLNACMETGEYPGYSENITTLGRPTWAIKEGEDIFNREVGNE